MYIQVNIVTVATYDDGVQNFNSLHITLFVQ